MRRSLTFMLLWLVALSACATEPTAFPLYVKADKPAKFEIRAVADKPSLTTREFALHGEAGSSDEKVLLESEILLDGTALRYALIQPESDRKFGLELTLTDEGGKRLAEATKKYLHKRLGLVLDNQIVVAPTVNEPIYGGSLRITGNFTFEQINGLVAQLNASVSVPEPASSPSPAQ